VEALGDRVDVAAAQRVDDDHAVLGVRNHARQELAGVRLDGQLFAVFTLREGRIVHLRDHAHRTYALSDAGLEYMWR